MIATGSTVVPLKVNDPLLQEIYPIEVRTVVIGQLPESVMEAFIKEGWQMIVCQGDEFHSQLHSHWVQVDGT